MRGLFLMYCSLEYVIFRSRTSRPLRRVILCCNVGWCVKGSTVHRSRQRSLVAGWLGLSVIVRVRVRARAREWGFSVLFFYFFCVKVTNTFVLHVNGGCDIHGLRTKVRNVTVIYCKKRYMENVSHVLWVFNMDLTTPNSDHTQLGVVTLKLNI